MITCTDQGQKYDVGTSRRHPEGLGRRAGHQPHDQSSGRKAWHPAQIGEKLAELVGRRGKGKCPSASVSVASLWVEGECENI